jgi:hypothetical protein
MIEPGLGAVVGSSIASVGALVVGVWGARSNRRTALDAQRSADRAKALVRVLHIAEANGRGEQDRIFNLTVARASHQSGFDPVTSEPDNPYAPARRKNIHELSREELAEGSALVAAYGSPVIDHTWDEWQHSLDSIAQASVDAEAKYWEDQLRVEPADFATAAGAELRARSALAAEVRRVLTRSRGGGGRRANPARF